MRRPLSLKLELVAIAVVALVACARRGVESPQFRSAFTLFNQVYAAKLDDAYGDPKMEDILRLLGEVDPKSIDAVAATELRDRIEHGQEEYEARMAAVAQEERMARRPVQWKGSGTNAPDLPKGNAAPAAASGPTLGMTRDEFLAKYANCFSLKGIFQSGKKEGEAYGVKEGDCAARFPALASSVVVLMDNRVSSLVPLGEVKTVTVTLDAGPPEVVEAPRPPPPPPAPPPPEAIRYYPGAPHPVAP